MLLNEQSIWNSIMKPTIDGRNMHVRPSRYLISIELYTRRQVYVSDMKIELQLAHEASNVRSCSTSDLEKENRAEEETVQSKAEFVAKYPRWNSALLKFCRFS